MNKFVNSALLFLFFVAAGMLFFAQNAFGQSVGCCCDPVVKNGSFTSKVECDQRGFIFAGPPPSLTVTCSQHCNATLVPSPRGVCGDKICQPSESFASCPADCLALVGGCGSPTYKVPPLNLSISPVTAKKAFRLTFSIGCPVDYVVISRCKGIDCTNSTKIAEIPPSTIFIDQGDDLEFNADYTFSVVAHYSISGDSDPAVAQGNLGDLECFEQTANIFCVSPFYYNKYDAYLKGFGYGQFSAFEFQSQFSRSVDLTFATRFNRAWQCSPRNVLIQPSPQVKCESDQFCVADERGAECVRREPCSVGTDPFGLFSNREGCEGLGKFKYCFFDKSTTVQDKCYSCDPKMSCYDYKGKDACERDNCKAGDCVWKSTFDDLGSGVCIDRRYNNCAFCSLKGTFGLENLNSSSELWDACREEKSSALSNDLYPCFFDKDFKRSKSCDEATCSDYSEVQCKSPVEGVRLNNDNSLFTQSLDVCKIGVCEYRETTGCVKNADGNTGVSFMDCRLGNKTCEQDYFAPTTTLIPGGVAGRLDFINLRIFDKINKLKGPQDFAGFPGYSTFLCVKSVSDNCANARTFSLSTKSARLLVKNGYLKEGNKTIAKLALGNNTVVYYSRDAANNVEELREVSIFACEKCNGPTLLNMSVTGGRVLGNAIHTSVPTPTFRVTFDEPTQLTFAEVTRPESVVRVQQLTSGMQNVHEFRVLDPLDGEYALSLNGHNDQVIYFDPPGVVYKLVVNQSLAGVSISPAHGSILNKTVLDVQLNFTDKVTLSKITLFSESYADPFVKKYIPRDITSLFKSSNNVSFDAAVTNVTGGGYRLVVEALGFNSLSVYKEVYFFVSTQKPSMRLVTPAFGVTAYSVFNASVETPLPSECAYVFDTPSAPSSSDFEFFNKFDGRDVLHSASGLAIPYGSRDSHVLHVYCKLDLFGIVQRSFNITLDPEPPVIKRFFAEPPVISEQYIPDKELFVTTLKAEIDKLGFCKYSSSVSSFSLMEGFFPGFDVVPTLSMGADVNVSERKKHSYYVACKGRNQLTSAPVLVSFDVDLSLPLVVSSSTPLGFKSTNFTVGVSANKRVFCYFGERDDDATRCMGPCRANYAHGQAMTVQGEGNYTYYVQCAHVSGEKSDVLEIPVLVDSSVPEMEFVDDTSSLPENPDITWALNKVRVAFRGKDLESGIGHYLVSLKSAVRNKYVFREIAVNVTDGKPFYLSSGINGTAFRLSENEKYVFIVKAVNNVGLESEPMESDGVTVDSSQRPEPCGDGEITDSESDVDCGGSCDGCDEGKSCKSNSDCSTNYCESKVCKIAKCDDVFMNGLETDVDCGGQNCQKCENEKSCMEDNDCSSDYCSPTEKVCEKAPLCADKELSQGESDVDCGGACKPCGDGQKCQESVDCKEGLSCDPSNKVCSERKIGDSDGDSVLDDVDGCAETPVDETSDESGCSPSQKFSLGDDISDKWRLDNFGCIECPEAASSFDADSDGLTNLMEFSAKTDPKTADSDGDGWDDGDELDGGFDPLDPLSRPKSLFLSMLWFVFVLLALAGIGYGGFIVYMMFQKELPRSKREEAQKAQVHHIHRPTSDEEIAKLRLFARKEELPEKDWISLEKEIKKKPLPKRKFEDLLSRLKKMASREDHIVASKDPLKRLRELLDETPEEERLELKRKFRQLSLGLLSDEERDELFARLKITSQYYELHRDEFEQELRLYGRHKRR